MGDVRDPERDQPLPKPGKLPVQQILIHAIEERREHGIRKYGRALETDNGRDALKDAWEESMDLLLYLTQMRLERGDHIEGMERLAGSPDGGYPYGSDVDPEGVVYGIRPHRPVGMEESRERERLVRELDPGLLIPAICPVCRHEPHVPGRCRSRALGMPCSCTNEI